MQKHKKDKVLVLGGASVHCKLVQAAKNMGLHVIVADYLQVKDSPAKQIAHESWEIDIYDVDRLAKLSRRTGVKGVLSTHLDPCQRPYCRLCKELNLPCYGKEETFLSMTNKVKFKQACRENGVGVISDYSIADVCSDKVKYPVFIKPVDSRGSRGQEVCYDRDCALRAIDRARIESSNRQCLIEDYKGDCPEIQITYFFVNGIPHLVRTADSYKGTCKGMEKVVVCATSPSRFTNQYIRNAENQVLKMFKSIGVTNGPAFMQGFVDGNDFRFFDPGLRFPGVDYELIYKKVYGLDLAEVMWSYALNGVMPNVKVPAECWRIENNRAAIVFPCVRAGRIASIRGEDVLRQQPEVVSFSKRHVAGDLIGWTFDVNQRYAEVDILCEDADTLANGISSVQKSFYPTDENGKNMQFDLFDASRILKETE